VPPTICPRLGFSDARGNVIRSCASPASSPMCTCSIPASSPPPQSPECDQGSCKVLRLATPPTSHRRRAPPLPLPHAAAAPAATPPPPAVARANTPLIIYTYITHTHTHAHTHTHTHTHTHMVQSMANSMEVRSMACSFDDFSSMPFQFQMPTQTTCRSCRG
jgi:hypothetical protein